MAVIRADAPLIGSLKLGDVAEGDGDPQSADPVLVDDAPGGEFVDRVMMQSVVNVHLSAVCLNCILVFLRKETDLIERQQVGNHPPLNFG